MGSYLNAYVDVDNATVYTLGIVGMFVNIIFLCNT